MSDNRVNNLSSRPYEENKKPDEKPDPAKFQEELTKKVQKNDESDQYRQRPTKSENEDEENITVSQDENEATPGAFDSFMRESDDDSLYNSDTPRQSYTTQSQTTPYNYQAETFDDADISSSAAELPQNAQPQQTQQTQNNQQAQNNQPQPQKTEQAQQPKKVHKQSEKQGVKNHKAEHTKKPQKIADTPKNAHKVAPHKKPQSLPKNNPLATPQAQVPHAPTQTHATDKTEKDTHLVKAKTTPKKTNTETENQKHHKQQEIAEQEGKQGHDGEGQPHDQKSQDPATAHLMQGPQDLKAAPMANTLPSPNISEVKS
ncbi:MAG: hypothetical protein P0S94_04265, partial [Simkaniaceae bacterium]|nr:hypothetical protein [Simkaniaceae bacterium]